MSGQEASAAEIALREKERRAYLPKPRTDEQKRVDKMRVEYLRMGIKPNF